MSYLKTIDISISFWEFYVSFGGGWFEVNVTDFPDTFMKLSTMIVMGSAKTEILSLYFFVRFLESLTQNSRNYCTRCDEFTS